MVTVLSLRLQKSLTPFTMLPAKGSFETGVFGRISNFVFRSVLFREKISYGSHLFLENVQNLM